MRIEYGKLIDVAIRQLSDRLLECNGLARYFELEAIIVSGKVVICWPELVYEGRSFHNQLEMFHTLVTTTADVSPHATVTLDKCASILRNMAPPMRAMFPLVEALVRLLLVNPASSATAERSFSSLRRLKTYLRSTCGQRRLNNLAFCHIHKDIMDSINVNELMKEFVLARDSRAVLFGRITDSNNQ
jgi:hypothetical protein